MSDDKSNPDDQSANKDKQAKKSQDKTALADSEAKKELVEPKKPSQSEPKSPSPEQKPAEKANKENKNLFTAKPAPRLAGPKPTKKSRLLPIIAILLALITITLVSWSSYQQHLIQKDWQELETGLNQQIKQQSAVNQSASQTAQSGLSAATDNQRMLVEQAQLIQQLRQSLTVTQERIRELSGRRHQDWMLAEAEYLIKLAEYKISLEKDKLTAIGLLKTADEKILAIGDNSLIELRQAIAQDIANIQLVVAPDVGGIAVQLEAIVQQIPELNIIALEFEPLADKEQSSKDESEEFSWEKLYKNFLDDFVEVKDHSQPVQPLMTLEQRGNLNANIQMALQQAQIALLRGEQNLYETNVDKASNWIKDFFKLDEPAQQILGSLEELRQNRVNIDLPKQLASKQAITAINQTRLYQWLQTPSANQTLDNAAENQL